MPSLSFRPKGIRRQLGGGGGDCASFLACRCAYTDNAKSAQRTQMSSILIYLRVPTLAYLLFPSLPPLGLTYLKLYPLPCPQHFALQVEATALLRIVHVEQPFELFVDFRQVCFARLRRRDIQDFAGFIEGQAGGGHGVGGSRVVLHRLGVLLRCRGLFVGFGEGAPEYPRPRQHDLRYYAVRLWRVLMRLHLARCAHGIADEADDY